MEYAGNSSDEINTQIILTAFLHVFCVVEFHPAVVCLMISTTLEKHTIGPALVIPSSTSIIASVVLGEMRV